MSASLRSGQYRSLFDDLPPLIVDEDALHALGRPGGPCDLGMSEAADAEIAAVWPFFGQFLAHDITADRSPLVQRSDPARIRNFRVPKANLEGVYGAGPAGSPYLYRKNDPARLLLSPSERDVPRNHEGIALIGDPRNDVHLFVNQMQVAFINFHNRFVEQVHDFDEARRLATWHYQHVILREFLPGLIGVELTADLLEHGPHTYRVDGDPYIPFEFADAAYRYGHAQIRDRYQVNAHFGPCPVFPDLMGFGRVLEAHAVDWALQIDVVGHPPAQRAKRIDARIPSALIALPREISGSAPGADYASLANRDLQRGQAVGLASGEAVADRLGVLPLSAEQIGLGWDETPLWFYILKEAEVLHAGERLGPVGGRIVGEVLVGIIDADPESFRALDPTWRPAQPGFGLANILVPC